MLIHDNAVQNLSSTIISQQKAVTQDGESNSRLPLHRVKEMLSNKRVNWEFLAEMGHCTAQTRQPLEIILQLFRAPLSKHGALTPFLSSKISCFDQLNQRKEHRGQRKRTPQNRKKM